MWTAIHERKWQVFWFDPLRRKVVPMGEAVFVEPQVDCDLGLATLMRYNRMTKIETGETYSLATGKLLSRVLGRPGRIGQFVMTPNANSRLRTYSDAVTGRLLWKEAQTNTTAEKILAPIGVPIWSTPKRWLFIIGEGGHAFNDKKGVVEVDRKTLKETKRVHLSDFAMAFDSVVGNPERGAFGVYERTNRSRHCTGVFRSDLSRVPGRFAHPSDISPYGILDRRGKEDNYGGTEFTSLVCADATTGKIKWMASSKEPGKWVGGNVLTGDRLLDGRSGRLLGKLKLPKLLAVGQDGTFVGIDGQDLVSGRIRAR
ncbi:MAG: hypothetical protein K1X67_03810 [Fimbriimonadaceae bacterium]|nr:hypothetical protein [Fimbriimonadaceae bacterium]